MSTPTLRKRFRDAQLVQFPGSEECSNKYIKTLIEAHCNAIGCPEEFLFVPLLSICAGFMSADTKIQFNSEWVEPAIIWTIVAAGKGERKSPALRRLKEPIMNIQNKMRQDFTPTIINQAETPQRNKNQQSFQKQLLIDVFSMEELHNVLLKNNYQIIGLYEEIKVLHQSLDIYKPGGSLIDRKQFLNLNGGSQWDRNFKNSGYCHLPKTHFNHAGMIQPLLIAEMMDKDDWDGFNDRYLISCPKEVVYKSSDYVVPIPDDLKNGFDSILNAIKDIHQIEDGNITYTVSEGAKLVFNNYHDNYYLELRQTYFQDDNRRGVLSKSLGYIIRLAGIITAIINATLVIEGILDIDQIETVISTENMEKAIKLMYYFNDTKFNLLPEYINTKDNSNVLLDKSIIDVRQHQSKLKRLLEFDSEGKVLIPAVACRNALIPPVSKDDRDGSSNRYPTWAAENFFKSVCDLGFGTIEEKTHTLNKKSTRSFLKRKFDELGEDQLKMVKSLKIDENSYINGTRSKGKENNPE